MKKLIAIVIAAMMVFTMVPAVTLTTSAAEGEGDFWCTRDVGGYKEPEDGELPSYKPASGYYYDAEGFHTVSPKFTGMTSRLMIRSKESMNLKDGMSLTLRIDEFPYGGDNGADEWLSFSLFDQSEMAPANTAHGNGSGWVCLIRGTGNGSAELQSFWQTPKDEEGKGGEFAPTGGFVPITAELDDEGREIYTLSASWDGSAYSVEVNGVELPGMSDVSEKMVALRPDGDFFFTFCTHSGVMSEKVSASITEYNGSVPTGTANVDPEENINIPVDIMDPTAIPENRPCFLWDSNATCHGRKISGDGFDYTAQADGSYRIKSNKAAGMYIEAGISAQVSYDASDFPVVAMLLRNYMGETSRFWYAAGDVGSVQNDCIAPWDGEIFYENEYEIDGATYNLALADIEGQWSGRINCIRLEFGGFDVESEDSEFDIMWWGAFRSTDEALAFLEDYKTGKYPDSEDTETDSTDTVETEEPSTVETEDMSGEETEANSAENTEAKTETKTEAKSETKTEAKTEAKSETKTEAKSEASTAAGTKAPGGTNAADTTAAAKKKDGCSSVIGGAVAVVLAAAAAAVALKKKH